MLTATRLEGVPDDHWLDRYEDVACIDRLLAEIMSRW